MLEIKTTRVDQAQRLTARGDIEPIYRVSFLIGEHGPFVLDFKQVDFIPERVRAEQEKVRLTIEGL